MEEMRSIVTDHKIAWENSKIITTKSAVPPKMLSGGLAIVIAPTSHWIAMSITRSLFAFCWRPTELRFQFTARGFSKCDAAFVHYSLFESYSLSGPKVSSGTSILVQCPKSKQNSVKPWFKNHTAIRTPLSSFREYPKDDEQMATNHRWCGWPRIESFTIKKCVHAVYGAPSVFLLFSKIIYK